MSLLIIIIDKMGELKTLNVKNYCEEELFKKCGFKKENDFTIQTKWNVFLNNNNYSISIYGKTVGKKNFENIFKFPYPIQNKTFYGSCALVCELNGNKINLNIPLWNEIYEKLTQSNDNFDVLYLNTNNKNNKNNSNDTLNDNLNNSNDINIKNSISSKKTKKNKEIQQQIIEYDDVELEEDVYYYSSDNEQI